MRTLKYAILGLINQKPMTGYDLMQYFESTMNEFWSAKHSQIYPELKKLTEEGAIVYEEIEQDGSPNKKVYSITEAGKKDFAKWLSSDNADITTPKDTFRLRLFFSSEMPEEDRDFLLQSHLLQHKNRLKHLKDNQSKFTDIPSKDDPTFGDYLVLMGAIMREENTIAWIEKCIKMYK